MEIKLIKYSGLLSYFSQACVGIGVQKKSMLDTLIRLDWKRQTHHQWLNETYTSCNMHYEQNQILYMY